LLTYQLEAAVNPEFLEDRGTSLCYHLTGGYGLVLPLMIANIGAFALARHWRRTPIYEALLAQDGIHLPYVGGPSNPDDNEFSAWHGPRSSPPNTCLNSQITGST
jgi:hypothetical protein